MTITSTTAGRNPSEPSIGVSKYIKKTLTNIQEIYSNTIIVRGLITPLSSIAYPDRKSENIDLK